MDSISDCSNTRRCIAPLLFPAYFRSRPMYSLRAAKHFIEYCPAIARRTTLAVVIVCGLIIGDLTAGIIIIGSCILVLFLLRRLMLQRLGGATGDTAGAVTEIIEATVYCCAIVLI